MPINLNLIKLVPPIGGQSSDKALPDLIMNINRLIERLNVWNTQLKVKGPVFSTEDGLMSNGALVQLAVVANYTVLDPVQTVLVNTTGANRTITLPAATQGRRVTVKKVRADTSAYTVTVSAGSVYIDNQTNWKLTISGSAMTVEADGTNWHIIGIVNGVT